MLALLIQFLCLYAVRMDAATIPTTLNLEWHAVRSNKQNFYPDSSLLFDVLYPTSLQNHDSIWFLDGRFKLDLTGVTTHHELNLGLVYRQPWTGCDLDILGAYAYVDFLHIQDGTYVQQLTLGSEYITRNIHTNLNLYFAGDTFHVDFVDKHSSSTIRSFGQHFFITDAGGDIATIKPLSGFDAMLEYALPLTKDMDIFLQGGYKSFQKSDFLTIQGPKWSVGVLGDSNRNQLRLELYTAQDAFHGRSYGMHLADIVRSQEI